jgi:hypothetical protein
MRMQLMVEALAQAIEKADAGTAQLERSGAAGAALEQASR